IIRRPPCSTLFPYPTHFRSHNRHNVNRSVAESLDDITQLIGMLHAAGATAEVIISTSFGCPYEGDVDPQAVVRIVDRVVADGARSEEHTSELQSRENLVCRL